MAAAGSSHIAVPTRVPSRAGSLLLFAGALTLVSVIINAAGFNDAVAFPADNYDHSYYGRAMTVNLAINTGATACLLISGFFTTEKRRWDFAYIIGLAGVGALSCANLPTTFNLLVNLYPVFWSTMFFNFPALIIGVFGCVMLASCRRDVTGDRGYPGKMLGFPPAASPAIRPGDDQAKRYLRIESGRETAGTLMIIVALCAFSYIYGSLYNFNERPNMNPPFSGPFILALYLLPAIMLTITAGASGFFSTVRKKWRLSLGLGVLSAVLAEVYFSMVFYAAMFVFEGRPYFINGFFVMQSIATMIFAIIAALTIGRMKRADTVFDVQ